MVENILSVGIDIGTSTTQLIFSRITLENTASVTSVPKVKITGKEVVYKGDIYFTPLKSNTEIDGNKIREIVEAEYKKANVSPKDLTTGAVIITGETARKENAAEVLKTLSGLAGDFVVATAGPDLEGILAGKGAGAHRLSKDKNMVVANLDVGGGTTNIAVFRNGEVIDTACLDIGGRLIRFEQGTLKAVYIAPSVKRIAQWKGIDIEEGREISTVDINKIAEAMAEILEEAVGAAPATPALSKTLTTKDLKRDYKIDCITFSGGVADFIYNASQEDLFRYGDIGVILGRSIRGSSIFKKYSVQVPEETIRATVVGAGTHTVEISGSTINYTRDLFPLKNIPILKMSADDEDMEYENLSTGIAEKLRWFENGKESQQVAIAIKGVKNPSFRLVNKIAENIIKGRKGLSNTYFPLLVIVENDMGKALGQALYRQLNYRKDVICIDSISVDNGDYIDIGKPLSGGRVVPVIIKTLVFNS